MIRFTLKYDSYSWFKLLLIFIWGHYFFINFFKVALNMLPYGDIMAPIMMDCIYIITIVAASSYMIKKIRPSDIMFIIIIMAIFIMSVLFFSKEMGYIFSKIPNFFFIILPLYFVGISININENIELLYKISLINLALQLVYQIFFREPMTEVESLYSGDMDIAYKILPHICLIVMYALEKSNIINIVFSILGFILLISSGTRGALLILLVFIFIYCILLKKVKHPMVSYPVFFVLVIALLMNFKKIFFILFDIAKSTGLSIRIFVRVLEGNFFYSPGRNMIREHLIEAVKEKPIIGHGIGSDYYIAGNYAHNIILELCVSFGIVIGLLMIGALFFIMLRSYFLSNSKYEKGLIIVFTTSIVMKLMLSGTYLDEYMFFLMIGVFNNVIRNNKQCKKLIL